jgi:hypothetical protein
MGISVTRQLRMRFIGPTIASLSLTFLLLAAGANLYDPHTTFWFDGEMGSRAFALPSMLVDIKAGDLVETMGDDVEPDSERDQSILPAPLDIRLEAPVYCLPRIEVFPNGRREACGEPVWRPRERVFL